MVKCEVCGKDVKKPHHISKTLNGTTIHANLCGDCFYLYSNFNEKGKETFWFLLVSKR
jgi:ribosome-binding protein aMBF1 (putative translation factor)